MDVLDRLQEDDRVPGLVELLDQPPLKAQVVPPVAQAGMLVGLRVRVDADDVGRRSGEHVGAVALSTGEIGDPEATHPSRDPLVHGQVPAKPVVLLGNVGQRALPREGKRRDAGGLVLLRVKVLGHVLALPVAGE